MDRSGGPQGCYGALCRAVTLLAVLRSQVERMLDLARAVQLDDVIHHVHGADREDRQVVVVGQAVLAPLHLVAALED